MKRVFRALLLSALATGAFAWVLSRLHPRPKPAAVRPGEVDADRLSPEAQERLLEELDRLL
ncbi:hypothetical protein ABUL39_13180 [Rhodothermus marinus]|uniref:hypothetical protein n=1 Tax=Rhodothermus marinus TaxID=29549 RepID=UPI0037C57289